MKILSFLPCRAAVKGENGLWTIHDALPDRITISPSEVLVPFCFLVTFALDEGEAPAAEEMAIRVVGPDYACEMKVATVRLTEQNRVMAAVFDLKAEIRQAGGHRFELWLGAERALFWAFSVA